MHIYDISAKYWKDLMKTLRGVDFTKYVLSVIIQTSHCKNYKEANSCNADPSGPTFLANVHCLMGKVWYNFEQNQTKAIKVLEQKPFSQCMYYQ